MIDLSKAGFKTSEFLHAASVAVAGFFVILGSFAELLKAIHETFPAAAWVSGIMTIVGGLMSVGASLGYSKSRAVVKAADAQVQVATIQASTGAIASSPSVSTVTTVNP